MGNGNRKLTIEILGDAKGVAGAVSDANGQMSKLASGVGDFAKKAAIGLAAGAVGFGAFVAGGLSSLQNIEKISAQTDAVLKSTGNAVGSTRAEIEDYAQQLEKKTSIEAESIQSGQNMLLTFTNVRNGVGAGNDIFNQATSIMTDMSVAMGTDVKAGAIQLGKALNDPIAGVAALGEVGVAFDEQQKKTIKTMVESGDVMGAQKIILAELNKEFGGSAAAFGDTTAGKIAKLKNRFGELQEAVAAKVLPVVLALTTWASDKGIPILERFGSYLGGKLAPIFAEITGGMRAFVAAFKNADGDITSAGFAGFLERLGWIARQVFDWLRVNGPIALRVVGEVITEYIVPALKKFGDFLADKVWPALKKTFEFMMAHKETLVGVGVAIAVGFTAWAVSAASAAVATLAAAAPVIALAVAIAALVAGVIYAYKHWGWFHDAVDAVASFMKNTLWPILKSVGSWFVDEFVPALRKVAGFIASDVIPAIAKIGEKVASVVGWIREHWQLVLGIITGPIGLAVAVVVKYWDEISAGFTAVKDWISGKVDDIVGFITELPGRVGGAFGDGFSAIKSKATDAKDWVSTKAGEIVGFITGIPAKIGGAATDFAKAGKDMGAALLGGIGDAVTSGVGFAKDIASAIGGAIYDFIDGKILGALRSALIKVAQGLASVNVPGVGRAFDKASSTIEDLAGGLHLPKLAAGGIVAARPGGIIANIGEGTRDEAVIPLPRNWRTASTSSEPRNWGTVNSRSSSETVTVPINITVPSPFGGRAFVQRLMVEISREASFEGGWSVSTRPTG